MNVFVLCTGRSGSVSFIQACKHVTNYSAGHESRNRLIGAEHFQYPPNHIEADNRLSWFLGSLDRAYGDSAYYVHLRRDELATAKSFLKRYGYGIMKAYHSIIVSAPEDSDRLAVCLDYVRTVNDNIELFLRDKSRKMTVRLENVASDFPRFWSWIGAEGDLAAAMSEWETPHNKSEPQPRESLRVSRYLRKPLRVIQKLPTFLRQA